MGEIIASTYIGLMSRLRIPPKCLANKNILAMSARLLEKSWHHLERWISSVAKTPEGRRKTKAITKTRLRGQTLTLDKAGIMGDPLLFFCICVGSSLSVPSKSNLHPSSPWCVLGGWLWGTMLPLSLALWLPIGSNQGKTWAGNLRVGGVILEYLFPVLTPCQYRLKGIIALKL